MIPTRSRYPSAESINGNANSAPVAAGEIALADRERTPKSSADGVAPTLFHRFKHDKTILALAVSEKDIFAGTEGGEILVSFLVPVGK